MVGSAVATERLRELVFGIPYVKTTIHTKSGPQEIITRLARIVGPGQDFRGKLTPLNFRIRRKDRSGGRDPYPPSVHGTLKSLPTGTEVTLAFWPRLVDLAEVVAFFCFLEYLAISKNDASRWWWPVVAFLFVHLGFYLFSFVPGQRWAETRLRSVIDT